MPTFIQIFKTKRKFTARRGRAPGLQACPQRRGVCTRILVMPPKKPNSANRRIAKIVLVSKKKITAHIPGIGHSLQKHGSVLVRGGRVKDLPGVRYRVVRGKYDVSGVYFRSRARSKYGKKKI